MVAKCGMAPPSQSQFYSLRQVMQPSINTTWRHEGTKESILYVLKDIVGFELDNEHAISNTVLVTQ